MKPEDQITKYLFANKSTVQYSTMDLVVLDVKLLVFYGKSPISDDEIRKIVTRWATIHAIGLIVRQPLGGLKPPATTPSSNSDSELVDWVKKAVSTVIDGVTIGRTGANINIGVTGLTVNLKKGDNAVSAGTSWGGTLKLDAKSGSFHFSGNLSKDKWEITLSYPQDTYIPEQSGLGNVFKEGERAIVKMYEATKGLSSIKDASKVGALISPHATKVQEAVDAASGIAKAKGGASFGFKLGSPEPLPGEEGIPKGVQGMFVFTYVF